MTALPCAPRPSTRPLLGAERAAVNLQHWQEARGRIEDPAVADALRSLEQGPETRPLLDLIFAYSPFLTDCGLKEMATLPRLFQSGPEVVVEEAITELLDKAARGERAEAFRQLRIARRRTALATGLADIAGRWALEPVVQTLSRLADRTLDAALAFLLRQAAARGEIVSVDADDPLKDCGYVVLGMGKLGARELNYSSDIDLIAIYDRRKIDYRGRRDVEDFCQRLTRDLLQLMSERTADGYVFRTDLRLRPDPGATPLAISHGAAMSYYESMGQNWERAAMIKARAVAGDKPLGKAFVKELRPFVWRKSLDFLAIQDIHSIKRQIHAHKGGGKIAIEGHNVKLGRGGIREIEFFAQTQQLIWGGRDPKLREPGTKAALRALAEAGHTTAETAEQLSESYDFLRWVEHRLQMIADQQTHTLPTEARGIAELADFLGYENEAALREALLFHFHRVEDHYAELFEEAPSLAGPGNLVFTGGEPEPGTVETLTGLGFADPEKVFQLVRSWHHGRYRATRSQRARELLTEILPTMLEELAKTADPDAALARFDGFLGGLPAGVQLFGLLQANPRLLTLIAEIMGSAPGLAALLSRRPGLLDAVLERGFFTALPDRAELEAELAARSVDVADFQDRLEIARLFANDMKFRVGVHQLEGLDDENAAGAALSDLADVVLAAMLEAVQIEFRQRHGTLPGQGLALLALGKLGSRELTAGSDLDLVMLWDGPDQAMSDGEKPLDATTYYTRLTQRLIGALSAPTGAGTLYEVDLRLRPAGNAGPVAQKLRGFRRYYARGDAWTWEHMALTRGRVVLAEPDFAEEIAETIRAILMLERDPDALLRDVAAMRERLHRDKPAKGPWDVKLRRGGLVDCEFIAQYLQLRHAAERPGILAGATDRVLQALAEAGLLPDEEAAALVAAVKLWRQVQGYLRLTAADGFDGATVPVAVQPGLAKACGALDFDALAATCESTAATVAASYDRIIAAPAAALGPSASPDPTS